MISPLEIAVIHHRTAWQIIFLVVLLMARGGLATSQQLDQQTDEQRKQAEKEAKQKTKEEERQRKEEENRAKKLASKKGCPFTPVRPIPEGKVIIYFYKASYGKDVYPIVVNGQLITYLQRGGYFPYITSPGKHEIFMRPFEGSGFFEGPGFFGTPATVINAEAGKEYYLELTTRFSARLHVHPEEKGLKKVGDDWLLLPYNEYKQEFASNEEFYADPVLGRISERWRIPMFDKLSALNTTVDLTARFKGGAIKLRSWSGVKIKFEVVQYGFAVDCGDNGVLSGITVNQEVSHSEQEPKTAEDYFQRGTTHSLKGELDLAMEDFNKAILLDPKFVLAFLNRAEVYRKLGKKDLADQDQKKAQELNRQKP